MTAPAVIIDQEPPNPAERVRLHITPFNPPLLDKIIPPSVLPLASNISFHSIQTFPERGYGYVELPVMEAQKLKKKLNGSTLKGAKVRIEEAKPEKKRKSDVAESGSEDGERKARKTRGKTREEGVIRGHEIEEGRRVKRGWKEDDSTSKDSKKRRKSEKNEKEDGQAVEGKKLRFKTSLPNTPMESEAKDKAKKSKEGKRGKKKVVVDEFDKTSKLPRKSADPESAEVGALTFEEGKGWVDDAGNVVEAEPRSSRRRSKPQPQEVERRISAIESREIPDDVVQHEEPTEQNDLVDNEGSQMSIDEPTTPAHEIDSIVDTTTEKEPHPLETLFKRPASRSNNENSSSKHRPKPINTSFSSFSFFDGGGAGDDGSSLHEDETNDTMMPPQTPHTKRDLEWRSIRSAAPTPDTAAIGRRFSFGGAFGDVDDSSANEEESRDDVEMQGLEAGPSDYVAAVPEDAEDVNGGREGKGKEESAFRKWFYENRGDLNRGWRKRRREEKKVLRQRENRRVSRRVV